MAIPRFSAFCAWLLLAFTIFSTVAPISMRPHDFLPAQIDRALAFFLLSAAFVMGYPKRWFVAAIVCVGSAFAIETLQFLSVTRHPHLLDASVKAVGAILGASLARGVTWSARLIQER